MKKGLLLALLGVIAVALALLGRAFWWGKPKPVTVVLTSPPTPQEALTVSGLHPPKVKPEWVKKMRAYENHAHWLDTPTWVTETVTANGKQVSLAFWQLPLVSTGQWGEITLTTRDGQTYRADVLYTLQLNAARQVLVVPLVMGVEHDGEYVAWPAYVTALPTTRSDFLVAARQAFSKGQILLAFAESPWANIKGIQWETCNFGKVQIPSWACDLGQDIEKQWPDYTSLLLRRVLMASAFPSKLFLYGVTPQPFGETWEVQP